MQNNRFVLLGLAVLALLFIVGQLFFAPKTYVESVFAMAFQAPRVLLSSLYNRHALVEQMSALQLENQTLRAELLRAAMAPERIVENKRTYITAPVFSTYPLNDFSRVLIGLGSDSRVATGSPVLALPGIFFGEVVNVFKSQTSVRTLFEPRWEIPVKIGPDNIDALFVGGHEPRLTLISRKRIITRGMSVVTAGRQYPYGLLLGVTGDPGDSDNKLFQEAPLVLPYVPADLTKLYILLTH